MGENDESDELDRKVKEVLGDNREWTRVWKRTEIQMDGDFSPAQLRAIADVLDPPDAYDGPRTISELPAAFEAATPETFWQPALDSHTRIDLDHAPGTPVMAIDVDPMTGKVLGEPRWTVTPYPRLTAAEVTEPGWYWYRESAESEWEVVQAETCGTGSGERVFLYSGDDMPHRLKHMPGTFIGPISPPRLP